MKTGIWLLPVLLYSAMVNAASFTLNDPGSEDIVDYSRYGTFSGTGTEKYRYQITDPAGLKIACGEGVYPNIYGVLDDPEYERLKSEKKLEGSQWDYINVDDCRRSFFKWATVNESPGIKQYYMALALEKSENYVQAVKAYYSIVVNFPSAYGYTYWKTVWYAGPVAINRIQYITRTHPEVCMKLVGAGVKIENGFDNIIRNDVYIVNPGELVRVSRSARQLAEPPLSELRLQEAVDMSNVKIKNSTGKGNVKLVQYSNNHWRLLVDDKPFIVHGMAYSPSKVGLSPDNGTLNVSRDWTFADAPYAAYVEKENPAGDFALMKGMGVNTLRIYHYEGLNKKLLKDGHDKYGFMYLIGNMLGMYATGSGAQWFEGTDYTNPEHKKNMLDDVRKMVEEYKDEPYVLMWVLGNENNYAEPGKEGVSSGLGCRARTQPEAYYKFVNETAKLIKSLDPLQRPVAVCNGDVLFLDVLAKNAPDIDVFGANAYRGDAGFGALWQDARELLDKPVIITEYGCPAYHKSWDEKKSEAGQAKYHVGNWLDIEANACGYGLGNALGGIVFEWVDEWWKAGPPPQFDPAAHETKAQFGGPFLDGWSYEEWYGICSQGDGSGSPYFRHLRQVYFEYQKMWRK